MLTWRAASVLFAIAFLYPCAAAAQNHQVHVPVSLVGLPPTLDRLSGICRFRDAAGVDTHNGNATRTIAGGRLVETVTFNMNPTVRTAAPESYACTFTISGRTERGETVQFRSDGSQAALGWRSVYETGRRGLYLPPAPSTMISRWIYGQFEKGEQTTPPPAASSDCPCGCTADGGARACTTESAPPPPPPATPSAPPPLRLPEAVSPSRVIMPSPAPVRAGALLPSTRINLTTSRFAYTSTGVTVAGP